jgi:excisionase family DNA binding protein
MTLDELHALCRQHGITVSLAGTVRLRDAVRLIADPEALRTLQRMCADGDLPAVRLRGTWRIPLAALVAYVVAVNSRDADPSTLPRRREHARRDDRCSIRRRSAAR